MKAIILDFQRRDSGARWPGGVLLACALLLCAGQLQRHLHFEALIEAHQDEARKLDKQIARAKLLAMPSESTMQTETFDRRIAAAGWPRWEALFAALEAGAGDDVTLLSMRPDGESLTLVGEAKNLESMSGYLRRLRGQVLLRKAFLANYELVKDHPQHPVRFTIAIVAETAPK